MYWTQVYPTCKYMYTVAMICSYHLPHALGEQCTESVPNPQKEISCINCSVCSVFFPVMKTLLGKNVLIRNAAHRWPAFRKLLMLWFRDGSTVPNGIRIYCTWNNLWLLPTNCVLACRWWWVGDSELFYTNFTKDSGRRCEWDRNVNYVHN
jgi:hypothetical protein